MGAPNWVQAKVTIFCKHSATNTSPVPFLILFLKLILFSVKKGTLLKKGIKKGTGVHIKLINYTCISITPKKGWQLAVPETQEQNDVIKGITEIDQNIWLGISDEDVEGEWKNSRNIVIKFPSYEKALEWYHSEEYKPVRQIRLDNADTNQIIIKGV